VRSARVPEDKRCEEEKERTGAVQRDETLPSAWFPANGFRHEYVSAARITEFIRIRIARIVQVTLHDGAEAENGMRRVTLFVELEDRDRKRGSTILRVSYDLDFVRVFVIAAFVRI